VAGRAGESRGFQRGVLPFSSSSISQDVWKSLRTVLRRSKRRCDRPPLTTSTSMRKQRNSSVVLRKRRSVRKRGKLKWRLAIQTVLQFTFHFQDALESSSSRSSNDEN
jgi:hypothetical protein